MSDQPTRTVKARKAKPSPCTCREQVDEELKKLNARLASALQMNFKTHQASMAGPFVAIVKLDSKKKSRLPDLVCTFCPFCGKRLRGDDE